MKCEICYKPFKSGIDLDSHSLFVHSIITKTKRFINNEVNNRLKNRYQEANRILSITIKELSYYKKAYRDFIGFGLFDYNEKWCNDSERMTKRQSNNRKTKKAKSLECIIGQFEKTYDQNVHRLYVVIKDIESYGMSEADFE